MTVQEAIDRINEDVYEVVSHFLELKKHGNKYIACCPFHSEKTPSFIVTPAKGMYKCFGCGKGGDAIHFIMEHEAVDFKEALSIGAKKLNFDFHWEKQDKFNDDEFQHLESLRIVCYKANQFFIGQLKNNVQIQQYITGRGFEILDDDPFLLGYAPSGNQLLKWAQTNGINIELLIEAGLIGVKENRQYDFFRERIMFPICNKSGKVVGFTGRTFSPAAEPKYLNSPETPIFIKGNELFSLNIARFAIKKEDRAYLVEGVFDVKRLHSINVFNVVAPCGTALTEAQAKLLKTYTNKVTLIYDGDDAGRKAIKTNAEILIKQKFHVSVIELPDKEDPDSLFKTFKIFEEYNEGQEDYILYKVLANKKKAKNPVYKSELIKEVTSLIVNYDEPSKHEVYIEAVSNIIKPSKAWKDELKNLLADKAPVELKSIIPKHVKLDDFHRYGFYVDNNSYVFRSRKGDEFVTQSNFVLTPLFHIESTTNAKRLYEVKNNHGITRVIEIPQKDLVSISAFKVRIESLGNFLWTGSETDLNRLKSWLYEKTGSCKEIVQVGWQKEGFFAWGNGIFNGKFTPVDSYGIVTHGSNNYYIPASSVIYQSEENLYEFERKFIHTEGNITLREYFKKFVKVFGDNGKIALAFYIAALFRDIIIRRFDKFPILNLFGPKGAGKNACAESLLYFFGRLQKVPNLHNTSKPALADHVANAANAICVFDEYRNDLEMEKREFLKGLWDGTGRTRMNMDKDKKKETTNVDQSVIVCGQQMATADIALFHRFMVLSFMQTIYTEEEEKNYVELKEINKRGLTHITHQILKTREYFKENYNSKVNELAASFKDKLNGQLIESRVFNNWHSVISAYVTVSDELEIPWDQEGLINLAVKLMVGQNSETSKNDDLGNFWKAIQFLISSNILFEGGDYKVEYTSRVTRRYMENGKWKKSEMIFPKPKRLFYLSISRVFSLYKTQALREGDKPLPDSTVEYYLKNSPSFLFETKKEPFKKIDPKSGTQEEAYGIKKRTSTSALVFDLECLPINTSGTEDDDTLPVASISGTESYQEEEIIPGDLPF